MNIYIFRLVKGDGEILEEIVSKDKHREINKVGWINQDLNKTLFWKDQYPHLKGRQDRDRDCMVVKLPITTNIMSSNPTKV